MALYTSDCDAKKLASDLKSGNFPEVKFDQLSEILAETPDLSRLTNSWRQFIISESDITEGRRQGAETIIDDAKLFTEPHVPKTKFDYALAERIYRTKAEAYSSLSPSEAREQLAALEKKLGYQVQEYLLAFCEYQKALEELYQEHERVLRYLVTGREQSGSNRGALENFLTKKADYFTKRHDLITVGRLAKLLQNKLQQESHRQSASRQGYSDLLSKFQTMSVQPSQYAEPSQYARPSGAVDVSQRISRLAEELKSTQAPRPSVGRLSQDVLSSVQIPASTPLGRKASARSLDSDLADKSSWTDLFSYFLTG